MLFGVALQLGAVSLLAWQRNSAGSDADEVADAVTDDAAGGKSFAKVPPGTCVIGVFCLGTFILLYVAWSDRDFTLLLSQAVFILCMIVLGRRNR